MPYAILALIPTTTGLLSAYHYAVGNTDRGRGFLFYTLTGWMTLPFSVVFIVAFPFVYATDWVQRRFYDSLMHAWAQLTCAPFFRPEIILSNQEWRGLPPPAASDTPLALENKLLPQLQSLPQRYQGKGVVYVANHQSWSDIYSLCWLGIPLKFISKKAIFFIPVAGWVMFLIGCVPLSRRDKSSGKDCLMACRERVNEGVSVFFFPEGTRTRTGQLQPFKIGAFLVAADSESVIIPITIIGTGNLMPPGHETTLRKGHCRLIVHDAILPHAPDGRALSATELSEQAYKAIGSALPN